MKHLIAAYSIENTKKRWQINEAEVSFLEKIYGNLSVKAFFRADSVMLNFKDALSIKGTLMVDAQGKISSKDGTLDVMKP
ncbi:hypothetical protein AAG747_19015 [Rapidithrix thailandica]|uniref:Uncharacterized protein n=1 Tax=Rapidithrix thailandica TaxID=413964 RepID=A0AAW9SFI1_9BACT